MMKILATTLFTCYIAGVGGLLTSHVVVFGGSYSDNGDGFAKYAQFVLRTNSVRPEALFALRCMSSFLLMAQAKSRQQTSENIRSCSSHNLAIYRLMLQTWPEEPYFKGRWSNGPMWIEEAVAALGVGLADYAAGGATTGSVPGREQLQTFCTFSCPCYSTIGTRQCIIHSPDCHYRRSMPKYFSGEFSPAYCA